MKRLITVLLLIALCPLQACMWYSAEAIEAWVVDAETNQPIEGVIVVAHWQLYGGLHPDNAGELTILETVTDKAGRFHFPAWGPKFANARLAWMDPEILLFKNGFKFQSLTNEITTARLRDAGPSLRHSEWNGKTIKLMKPSGTAEKYAENVDFLSGKIYSLIYASRGAKECYWKLVPQMITALHKLSLQFEAQDVKLPGWRGGQRILTIDHIPGEPKCGSKSEFFRSYLQ